MKYQRNPIEDSASKASVFSSVSERSGLVSFYPIANSSQNAGPCGRLFVYNAKDDHSDVCLWQIVLQKSFCGMGLKFSVP